MSYKTLGSTLLVAGTAIGGGMLALPVLTGEGGFLSSLIVYTACWFLMMATGLLYLEIYLWHSHEVNIISMAKTTLGNTGKLFAWLIYLFLFYSLCIAYISGGGQIVNQILNLPQSSVIGPVFFTFVFGGLIVSGNLLVDRMNRVCVALLIATFLGFVFVGLKQVRQDLLLQVHFSKMFVGLPVVALSFGFQGIVPTLTTYLDKDPKKVFKAILGGSFLTLLCYLVWQAVILGIIPKSDLREAKVLGENAIAPLKQIISVSWLSNLGESFALLAIVTSFFGVSLGLLDFLADGMKVKKNPKGRFALGALILIPSLIWSLLEPKLFLKSLEYGGGIGGMLLLVLLPAIMAWKGRYHLKLKGPYRLFGGKVFLIVLIAFALFTLGLVAKAWV